MKIIYIFAISAARVPLKAGRAVNAFLNLWTIAKYIAAEPPKQLASFAIVADAPKPLWRRRVARATAAEWRRSENAINFVLHLIRKAILPLY
jgi:hypothetical protein